ncbi:OLC1v1004860C1, partial [Oldenlandia corymbosa var. corymbosa]
MSPPCGTAMQITGQKQKYYFLEHDMKIPGDLSYYFLEHGKDMDEGLALLSFNDSANPMAAIGLEHGLVDLFMVHPNEDGELSDDEDDPVDSQLTREVLTPRMIRKILVWVLVVIKKETMKKLDQTESPTEQAEPVSDKDDYDLDTKEEEIIVKERAKIMITQGRKSAIGMFPALTRNTFVVVGITTMDNGDSTTYPIAYVVVLTENTDEQK